MEATAKQITLANKMGIDWEGKSKHELSQLISAKMAEKYGAEVVKPSEFGNSPQQNPPAPKKAQMGFPTSMKVAYAKDIYIQMLQTPIDQVPTENLVKYCADIVKALEAEFNE